MTAETVMIGTVAVLGGTVGLSTVATAVDAELKEYASAIRSLDQSYGYVGKQSCGAWTAGSYYHQPHVGEALAELCGEGVASPQLIREHVDAHRQAAQPAFVPPSPSPAPAANDLPKPTAATPDPKKTAEPSKPEKPKKPKDKDREEDGAEA